MLQSQNSDRRNRPGTERRVSSPIADPVAGTVSCGFVSTDSCHSRRRRRTYVRVAQRESIAPPAAAELEWINLSDGLETLSRWRKKETRASSERLRAGSGGCWWSADDSGRSAVGDGRAVAAVSSAAASEGPPSLIADYASRVGPRRVRGVISASWGREAEGLSRRAVSAEPSAKSKAARTPVRRILTLRAGRAARDYVAELGSRSPPAASASGRTRRDSMS